MLVLEGGVGLFGVLIVGYLVDLSSHAAHGTHHLPGFWYTDGTRVIFLHAVLLVIGFGKDR